MSSNVNPALLERIARREDLPAASNFLAQNADTITDDEYPHEGNKRPVVVPSEMLDRIRLPPSAEEIRNMKALEDQELAKADRWSFYMKLFLGVVVAYFLQLSVRGGYLKSILKGLMGNMFSSS